MSPQETLIVTGSSGLIGSAFIDHVGPHYREIGLDREGPPHPPPETEIVISCDVGSDDSVREAFAEVRRLGHGRIASVVHLAACVAGRERTAAALRGEIQARFDSKGLCSGLLARRKTAV